MKHVNEIILKRERFIHTYIYTRIFPSFFFLTNFRDWTRVKRRKGTIFLAYPRAVVESWRVPRSFQIHILRTCAPHSSRQSLLPPPSSFLSRHILSITITDASTSARPNTGLPHDPSHPTLRARVSLAPFNHATPPPSPPPLPPLYCLPRSLVGIILALGNYRWTRRYEASSSKEDFASERIAIRFVSSSFLLQLQSTIGNNFYRGKEKKLVIANNNSQNRRR